MLAPYLASQFSETGLWPLFWRWPEEPDAYLHGATFLDTIDEVNVREMLAERWQTTSRQPEATEPFTTFPGLADPTPTAAESELESVLAAGSPFDRMNEGLGSPRLLLVPCNRPADALTVVGGPEIEIAPYVVSAMLRSWEDRFQATAYEIEPSAIKLSVKAPPTATDQALHLAAEMLAFCPPEESFRPSALRTMADDLLQAPAWYIGWYD
jgi:hypothetical protein